MLRVAFVRAIIAQLEALSKIPIERVKFFLAKLTRRALTSAKPPILSVEHNMLICSVLRDRRVAGSREATLTAAKGD